MICLDCGRQRVCEQCWSRLHHCKWHTPGIVRSNVPAPRASAWLIDPWGRLHAVEDGTYVGRQECPSCIIVNDRRISDIHARFEKSRQTWILRDRCSTNGTSVNGLCVSEVSRLRKHDIVRFSPLAFLFWDHPKPPHVTNVTPTIRTAPSTPTYELTCGRFVVVLRPSRNSSEEYGGLTDLSTARSVCLSQLQYTFLAALCRRSVESKSPSLSFVSATELSETLPFQAKYPSPENVRQLAFRVRRLLSDRKIAVDSNGTPIMFEASNRLGYRIIGAVRRYDENESIHSGGPDGGHEDS